MFEESRAVDGESDLILSVAIRRKMGQTLETYAVSVDIAAKAGFDVYVAAFVTANIAFEYDRAGERIVESDGFTLIFIYSGIMKNRF